MATLPHHDAPRRGTKLYLRPQEEARAQARPVAKRPQARPSRVQRMAFIFGVSTMLWLGIAAAVMAF